jgi:uncharacterized protein (DUF486 family)
MLISGILATWNGDQAIWKRDISCESSLLVANWQKLWIIAPICFAQFRASTCVQFCKSWLQSSWPKHSSIYSPDILVAKSNVFRQVAWEGILGKSVVEWIVGSCIEGLSWMLLCPPCWSFVTCLAQTVDALKPGRKMEGLSLNFKSLAEVIGIVSYFLYICVPFMRLVLIHNFSIDFESWREYRSKKKIDAEASCIYDSC